MYERKVMYLAGSYVVCRQHSFWPPCRTAAMTRDGLSEHCHFAINAFCFTNLVYISMARSLWPRRVWDVARLSWRPLSLQDRNGAILLLGMASSTDVESIPVVKIFAQAEHRHAELLANGVYELLVFGVRLRSVR